MEHTFTKKIMYEDESTLYREFNQISLDQIESTTSFPQEETIYRSVSVLSQPHAEDSLTGYSNNHGIPMATMQREINKKSFLCTGMISPSSSAGSRNLKAPELPDLLLPSHFEVTADSDIVCSQIEKFLRDTNGLSYDFNSNLFQVCVF